MGPQTAASRPLLAHPLLSAFALVLWLDLGCPVLATAHTPHLHLFLAFPTYTPGENSPAFAQSVPPCSYVSSTLECSHFKPLDASLPVPFLLLPALPHQFLAGMWRPVFALFTWSRMWICLARGLGVTDNGSLLASLCSALPLCPLPAGDGTLPSFERLRTTSELQVLVRERRKQDSHVFTLLS